MQFSQAPNIREIPVVRSVPLSWSSIAFVQTFAISLLWIGYALGAKFVRDEFYLGGSDVTLLGAYPGGVITYGLVSQAMLDLMATKPGQKLDGCLEDLGKAVVRRFHGNRARVAPEETRQSRDFVINSEPSPATWDNSKTEIAKLASLRLGAYFEALLVGVGVIGLPVYFIYDGQGIDDFSKKVDCTAFTILGGAAQCVLFVAASRGYGKRGHVQLIENQQSSDSAAAQNSRPFLGG